MLINKDKDISLRDLNKENDANENDSNGKII